MGEKREHSHTNVDTVPVVTEATLQVQPYKAFKKTVTTTTSTGGRWRDEAEWILSQTGARLLLLARFSIYG